MARLVFIAKCNDCFFCNVLDNDYSIVAEKDGYVPRGLGIGGGDYIELTIDLETGKVIGWDPLTVEQAKEIVQED